MTKENSTEYCFSNSVFCLTRVAHQIIRYISGRDDVEIFDGKVVVGEPEGFRKIMIEGRLTHVPSSVTKNFLLFFTLESGMLWKLSDRDNVVFESELISDHGAMQLEVNGGRLSPSGLSSALREVFQNRLAREIQLKSH